MPNLKTELTEIVTGLGMLGIESLDTALATRPSEMRNVTTKEFDRLSRAREAGDHEWLFEQAWGNGRAFAVANDALRNRDPQRIEWKGSHQPPGYEQVPADLRVDYVYLVSCKYMSKILFNASPAHLFDRLLATRRGRKVDWYAERTPDEYQEFYGACRSLIGGGALPMSVRDLTRQHRDRLKKEFKRIWPEPLAEPYGRFCAAVSAASAQRWKESLKKSKSLEEEMLWRLLRLQSAPYFILGAKSARSPVRYRVGTPWDFRQRYSLQSFEVNAETDARQPKVRWSVALNDRVSDAPIRVEGHVEIRWSHGRFGGAPEAKVYLDTPYEETPGYNQLR